MVYATMLKVTGYAPYSVPPLRNVYGTLTSSEEVPIYADTPALHFTAPGDNCSHLSMTNLLHSRSPYNRPPCFARRCMAVLFF